MIEQAIAENMKFGKPEDGDPSDSSFSRLRAREYLEKICQELWHLPAMDQPHLYLKKCLEGYERAELLAQVAETTRCLPQNPRKVKSIANVLRRYAKMDAGPVPTSVDRGPYPEDYCQMLVACLYCLHPEIYSRLEVHDKFFEVIKNWTRDLPDRVPHELLAGLKLPARRKDDVTGDRTRDPESQFIDPNRANAFLLGGLFNAQQVNADNLRNFLLR